MIWPKTCLFYLEMHLSNNVRKRQSLYMYLCMCIFRRDIPLFGSNDLDALNVEELVDQYGKLLVSLVDSHATMLEKQIRLRQDTVWYTYDLRVEKRTKRQRERSWRKSRLEVNRQL